MNKHDQACPVFNGRECDCNYVEPPVPAAAVPELPDKFWCETCEGTGSVYQEHQIGCHVGGDFPCPDCDGKGYWIRAYGDARALAALSQGWMPIAEAPQNSTPVDLWRDGERCVNMRRVDLGNGNVFYEAVEAGATCVRDASHFMMIPAAPKAADGEAK